MAKNIREIREGLRRESERIEGRGGGETMGVTCGAPTKEMVL